MAHDRTLNPAQILAALGITAAGDITPVHGGADTAIWRVAHDGMTSALRVFRPEQTGVCGREIEALAAARAAGVPVPRVRTSGVWQGRAVQLLSWRPGVTLWEAVRRQPWRAWSLGKAFGRAQAQIHGVASPAAWQGQDRAWIGWAGPEAERLQAALARVARREAALLHLDYHPLNVLTDGRRITAVLDWVNSRAGDPRADVARTYTILRVEPYVPGREPLLLSVRRRLVAWGWRRGYEQVAGPLGDMALFYAWAGRVMARDLAWRVSDPQSWWQPRHLARIEAWAAAWQRRAEGSTVQ